MNKKELTILATQEAKLYQNIKKYKQATRYFYNVAVKKRREGDVEEAKMYWKFAKDAYNDMEKVFASWNSLFTLKNQLGIDIIKYQNAVDKKELASSYYNPFEEVGEIKWSFIWAIKKTIF